MMHYLGWSVVVTAGVLALTLASGILPQVIAKRNIAKWQDFLVLKISPVILILLAIELLLIITVSVLDLRR